MLLTLSVLHWLSEDGDAVFGAECQKSWPQIFQTSFISSHMQQHAADPPVATAVFCPLICMLSACKIYRTNHSL